LWSNTKQEVEEVFRQKQLTENQCSATMVYNLLCIAPLATSWEARVRIPGEGFFDSDPVSIIREMKSVRYKNELGREGVGGGEKGGLKGTRSDERRGR
jgi:hypothetical protein